VLLYFGFDTSLVVASGVDEMLRWSSEDNLQIHTFVFSSLKARGSLMDKLVGVLES